MFSRTHEQSKCKQRLSGNFALHSQHYLSDEIRWTKKVLNTAATEGSCCFISIRGKIDEAEIYDTKNVCLI